MKRSDVPSIGTIHRTSALLGGPRYPRWSVARHGIRLTLDPCRELPLPSRSARGDWRDDRSKHIRQWLGCGNTILHHVFPISKTCWSLFGMPKTSRDTKKHCGEPGCPNDDRRKMLARWDEVVE